MENTPRSRSSTQFFVQSTLVFYNFPGIYLVTLHRVLQLPSSDAKSYSTLLYSRFLARSLNVKKRNVWRGENFFSVLCETTIEMHKRRRENKGHRFSRGTSFPYRDVNFNASLSAHTCRRKLSPTCSLSRMILILSP